MGALESQPPRAQLPLNPTSFPAGKQIAALP